MNKKTIHFVILFCISIHAAHAQLFVNGSLENWGMPRTCEINYAPDGWINFSNGCSALDEARFPLCPSTIPPNASEGNVYGRACCGGNQGEGIAQTVSRLLPGQWYTISFDYAGSNLYGGGDSVNWNVFIDNVQTYQTPTFSSADSNWSTFSVGFEATLATHTFGFRAYGQLPVFTGGSAGIDNIQLTGVETGISQHNIKKSIQVYPTIIDKELFIKTESHDALQVLLFDLNAIARVKQNFTGEAIVNVEQLPNGIYFCLILQNNAVVSRQTLIKQ